MRKYMTISVTHIICYVPEMQTEAALTTQRHERKMSSQAVSASYASVMPNRSA